MHYAETAERYCRDIRAGRIASCKWTQLACQRHLNDLARQDDAAFPYYFDPAEAWNVCDFAEKLPHVEGSWPSPTLVLEAWQVFILACVFGWRRKADGLRRFSDAYIELARKNGKSFLSAVIGLYCLTCEDEPGPQVKLAATTGAQARIVFDVAKKIVRRTPALRQQFGLEAMAHAIPCAASGGAMQPINAKASTQDGLNPHLSIVDELHAHKSRALFDVLQSARGARRQPLSWYITTAGFDTAGVCYEQRDLVLKILQGVFAGDHYFGIIYTLDDGDDPYDPAAWAKANPNLGVSVNRQELAALADVAKVSPASEGNFKTKRCNIWCSAPNAWLNMAQWDACADTALRPEDFAGEDCWIACDLASKNDVACAASIFRRDGRFIAFVRHYLPEELVEACAHRTHAHYLAWAAQGHFVLTPGAIIDYAYIEADIREWSAQHRVQCIGFDPYQSTDISTRLLNDGLPALIVPYNTKTISDPAKELEARVQAGTFRHDGDPVLKWMASNACVARDRKGNILPMKIKPESPNKIDGIAAVCMALSRAILTPPPAPPPPRIFAL